MPSRLANLIVLVAIVSVAALHLAQAVDKPAAPREVDKLTALPGTVTRLNFALDGKTILIETFFQPPPPRPGLGIGGTGNPGYPVTNHLAWGLLPRKVTMLHPIVFVGGSSVPSPDLHTMATWHAIGPETQLHRYYDVTAALKGEKPNPKDIAKLAQPAAPTAKADRPRDWKWLEPTLEPMAFSADGKVAAAKLAKERAVVLFDVAQDKQIAKIELPGPQGLETIPGVVFSADGKLVAVPRADGSPVRVCEVAGGKERCRVGKFFAGSVLALTPDGQTMALGNPRSGELQLWDTATGKRTRTWQTTLRGVNDLDCSRDGKVLFAAGDRGILIWDIAGGREIAQLRGHQAAVSVLAVSPDGQRLASGGRDKAVHLWDISAYAPEGKSPSQSSGDAKP